MKVNAHTREKTIRRILKLIYEAPEKQRREIVSFILQESKQTKELPRNDQ